MDDVLVLQGAPRFSVSGIRRAVADSCRTAGAERAILFGSYARGTADEWSDVDLIIVHETEEPFLERWRLFKDLVLGLPGCELLVYTPCEVARMSDGGLVGRAMTEGVVLYERSGEAGTKG